jgi:transposase
MKAYPIELRTRVINYLKRGGSVTDAQEKYEVGRDTVYRWQRLEKAGSLAPKKSWGKWKKIDPTKLKMKTDANADLTLAELAAAFGVTATGIFHALRKLEITLKKSHKISRKKRA